MRNRTGDSLSKHLQAYSKGFRKRLGMRVNKPLRILGPLYTKCYSTVHNVLGLFYNGYSAMWDIHEDDAHLLSS